MINLDNVTEITVLKEHVANNVKYFNGYKLFGFIPVNGVYWTDEHGRPIFSIGREAKTIEEFVKENDEYYEVNGEIWNKACITLTTVNDDEYLFPYKDYESAKKRFDQMMGLYNSGEVKIFSI